MKNIFKYFIPSLALVLGLASCGEDEKGFTDPVLPGSVALENVTVVSYNTISATLNVTNPENNLEQGLEVATTEDFSDSKFIKADTIIGSSDMTIGANPETTYYIRGYAFQKNSNVLKTEAVVVTTPEYTYPVAGTYTTTEIWAYDFDNGGFNSVMGTDDYPAYDITIEEGEDGMLQITNLYELESTVVAFYDEETGVIQIPGGQQVMEHSTYGSVYIVGFTDELDDADAATFYFDKKTGALESGFWGIRVAAGFFDIMAISAQHK